MRCLYAGSRSKYENCKLKFSDGTTTTQQKSGFQTKKEANKARDTAIAQLYVGTYVAYGKVKVAQYMTYWLEEVMKKRITYDSYHGYRNVVNNYIIPQIGNKYMETVMRTAMQYARNKNIICADPTEDVRLPKNVKKKKFREREIDVARTLTEEQVECLSICRFYLPS